MLENCVSGETYSNTYVGFKISNEGELIWDKSAHQAASQVTITDAPSAAQLQLSPPAKQPYSGIDSPLAKRCIRFIIRSIPSAPPPSSPAANNYSRWTILSATASESDAPEQPDDYHATLKALNSRSRVPRKSLGQHYMLSGLINEQLVSTAGVKEGDVVLEIGPGTGSLTNVLIEAGALVLAIEKGSCFDPHMAALVRERFSSDEFAGSLQHLKCVLEEDFTKCNFRSHLESLLERQNSVSGHSQLAKAVANIPFNISTDVVKQLLPMGDIFSEVVLLLQDEAALRLVEAASSRNTEYRPINIFVNYYSDPEYKFQVPRANFFPQPNVDAAVVKFKLKRASECPSVSSTKSFFSLVNSAFNGKRKMLRRSLQHLCSSLEVEEALSSAGLPTTSRPEELTMDDFVKLHNLLIKV
ncbi:unnamed protein product [Rhodiola kirilowii]